MSFEFHGGLLVLDLLKKEGAPTAQAESVAEAVIRHQDLGETGFVTSITAVILLATIFGESYSFPQTYLISSLDILLVFRQVESWRLVGGDIWWGLREVERARNED